MKIKLTNRGPAGLVKRDGKLTNRGAAGLVGKAPTQSGENGEAAGALSGGRPPKGPADRIRCAGEVVEIGSLTPDPMNVVTVRYVPIVGFSKYQVGDDGNVRHRVCGDVWWPVKPIRLAAGYAAVSMTPDDGSAKVQCSLHVLVLTSFVGPRPSGMVACHNNGIKIDNRLSNLRWGTYSSNELDKREHGTAVIGERNSQHVLTVSGIRQIRRMLTVGVPKAQIAKQFGVTPTTIGHIARGRTWSQVS